MPVNPTTLLLLRNLPALDSLTRTKLLPLTAEPTYVLTDPWEPLFLGLCGVNWSLGARVRSQGLREYLW